MPDRADELEGIQTHDVLFLKQNQAFVTLCDPLHDCCYATCFPGSQAIQGELGPTWRIFCEFPAFPAALVARSRMRCQGGGNGSVRELPNLLRIHPGCRISPGRIQSRSEGWSPPVFALDTQVNKAIP